MDLEEKRLEELRQYNILDTPPEEAFDNLAKLATHICGTSSAQINFLDDERQWAKANIGWGGKEMPREMSFCTHTIGADNGQLIISDAQEHEFFKNNPLVEDKPPLRFYAGVSIHSVDNYPLGTICVFDSEPRDIPNEDIEALHILAKEVETHLELRVGQDQLKEILKQENQLNQQIISSLPVNFFMYDSQEQLVRWNEHVTSTTGYSEKEIKQMTPTDFFSGDEQKKMKKKVDEVFSGKEIQFEITIDKKDGTTAPFLLGMSRFTMDGQQYLIGTGQDLTKLKSIEKELKESLEQKEILLSEIHHRVKNNLAIISGLLEMESYNWDEENDKVGKAFRNSQLRIQSIAKIHEKLYQSEDLANLKFNTYLREFIHLVLQTQTNGTEDIEVDIHCDENIEMNVNQAMPTALIINELITNAVEHAFTDIDNPKLTVSFKEEGEQLKLSITDNSNGIPKNLEDHPSDSLGMTIVEQLVKQLNANFDVSQNDGISYKLSFKKGEVSGSSSNYFV